MMKKNSHLTFVQFLLRTEYLAQQQDRSEQGYAMVIVAIVSVVLFSLLVAYLTLVNLTKSSTNAYIDGTNTFYVAESGLNQRANALRQKFIGYAVPTGTSPGVAGASVTAANISNCFSSASTTLGTGDFQCQQYASIYNNNAATSVDSNGNTVISDVDNNQNSVRYTAFTFVSDRTNYILGSNPPTPQPETIPAGQTYAGLNALEYLYTVYSTAAKVNPSNPTNPLPPGDAQTVLQMNFRSRVVPLFQFAVFYNGDLEMTSTPKMIIGGRLHTNGNLYAQTTAANPAGAAPTGITTYFNDRVTSAGEIYDRADASFPYQGQPTTSPGTAAVRVLQSGNPITNTPPAVYFPDSYFRSYLLAGSSLTTPLSSSEIAAFNGQVKDGAAGATVLNTPEAGFLRKRNYFNNNIGRYYAAADLRLEMVPDRDVTDKTATPWTRNTAIIPFNFTSIQTGGAGTCTTTPPVAGSDPAPTYIDPARMNAGSLHCNVFTKGQLQSLRQPVMVLTNINQPNTALRDTTLPTTASPSPALGNESTILGRPTTFPALPTGLTTAVTGSVATQQKILRALQVALVSTPSPVSIDRLNNAFNTYTSNSGAIVNGSLLTFQTTFGALLNSIGITTGSNDYNALLGASPNAIAALQGAWFLPAPVQRVENNNTAVQIAQNIRNSGFYDSREQRWITLLQTNLLSLSVWNRDGLYVEAANTDLTTPYSTTTALQNATFNSGAGANFTTGVAFTRSAPTGTFGLPLLGLGASDKTEGGLVLHATVNDDLDGDGAIVAANDVTADAANPIYKKNPDGTNFLDPDNGNLPVKVDYPRKYPSGTNGNRSPFGFAFNGGNYLPGAMTLTTDRAGYIQGDFNNNGAAQPTTAVNVPDPNRFPAAFMADTITILSNQCMSGQSVSGASLTPTNYLNTPGGQIDCGIPSQLLPPTVSPVNAGIYHYIVTAPTAVNAAFLSGIVPSCGNLGRPACAAGTTAYSGGLNNYYRLLEGWTTDDGSAQQYFNYHGSFVSLGAPLEYSGQWIPGSPNGYAHVPTRNFNFDTNFNSFSLLPPLTPSAIYLKQDVFKRAYN
jgi:Tfp pilus assembly protein PilX